MSAAKPSKVSVSDFTDPEYFWRRLQERRGFLGLVESLLVPPRHQRTIPTTAGWVLILVSIGLGGAAYNNASNILFLALALLLSCLILSGILSQFNFRKVEWELTTPDHLRAGEQASFQIKLRNGKQWMPTFSLRFRGRFGYEGTAKVLFQDGPLAARSTSQIDWLFKPQRRGTEPISISGMESEFPFGFLRKVNGRGILKDVRVWPARVEYEREAVLGRQKLSTEAQSRRSGGGGDLINLRDYRAGDPPRTIHWKASARQGTLLVRQNAEERQQRHILHVETSAKVWTDQQQFETMCSLAGSLAEDFFKQGQLLGYRIDYGQFHPVTHQSDLHQFFDELALLRPQEGTRSPLPAADPEALGTRSDLITFHPMTHHHVCARIGGNPAATAVQG